jgi:DNA-binding transcriptional regulator GbsR (MarR family)
MSDPRRTAPAVADWRESFVEELGVLALDMGVPRAMARVLAWMVVCEPPEQSARDIQTALKLSAGAVSAATRVLIGSSMLERVAHPGDRHAYYRLRSGTWDSVLEARLRTLVRLGEVAGRALLAADEADQRLSELRDVYAWFELQLDDLLAKRRAER